ncbi:ER membrane protein complex subunit 8-like [Acanthaster planci]|uniref:ER membrane protein complex subunit 8-like n=1 Tax=Acanthaster planci TaxID=133434 RepID=A0A8B7XR19_ACAPL|nr:ER membrane protein complex subunit 8-like [Acanthaster planci]
MAETTLSNRAYCKLIMHAAKYPHAALNGVLLAEKRKLKENKILRFVDCVPMCHLTLGLAPVLEVAFFQIDSYCQANGLIIAGYYHANEHLKDSNPSPIALKIADKIYDNCNEACLFMIDNTKMLIDCDQCILKQYTVQDSKWKPKSTNSPLLSDDCLSIAADLLREKTYQDLVDFDNHLDDITSDWLNPEINAHLNSCT